MYLTVVKTGELEEVLKALEADEMHFDERELAEHLAALCAAQKCHCCRKMAEEIEKEKGNVLLAGGLCVICLETARR